jgi:Domain of unknown function (DUF6597)
VSDEKANNLTQPVSIEFQRYDPSLWLKPYVRNYWMLQCSGVPALPRRHRVIPDGCIDLIFMRRSATEDYRASIVGTMTRPIEEELASHVDYIGIRFNPGGFRHFFQTPPREFTDRIVSLDDLLSQSGLAERLADSHGSTASLESLEDDLGLRPPNKVHIASSPAFSQNTAQPAARAFIWPVSCLGTQDVIDRNEDRRLHC